MNEVYEVRLLMGEMFNWPNLGTLMRPTLTSQYTLTMLDCFNGGVYNKVIC